MRAIIETGGKQYRVAPGDKIMVEKLDIAAGATVEFDRVLMVDDDGDIQFGRPVVAGAKVVGHVLEHDKDDKLIVFKFKAKSRYRRKTGHRQPRTQVRVTDITRS